MNLFFEESGDFKAGTVLTQQGEAFQVETLSGKRSKVRARDVLLQFETPTPSELISKAARVSSQMDVSFLWEVAGDQEFSFTDLGVEYFGHAPSPEEAAGLLLALASAPIYFHKKGKGRYKAAPAEILQAALAGVEKKKQQVVVQAKQVEELKAGILPATMASQVYRLLFKPDKNTIEYKALEAACQELQTSPARLMLSVGAISSPRELHMNRFLSANFPRGIEFPDVEIPAEPSLSQADVEAFSIDDVTTTEIDDAFSVRIVGEGRIRIGIHIAAPGMAISPGDVIDKLARERMSTVYMPGDKITMLPDELVSKYTLAEGDVRPALSLYTTVDTSDWSVIATETVAEAVPVKSNLRHNDLDEIVTEENLLAGSGDYTHKHEIELLWQWAQTLERARMQKRESFGLRPEQNNRVDYNFYVEDETVTITRRKRGAPLDKIVAELMIYANSSWGRLLHEHGVPGIYRTQGAGNGWAARMQVRMLTHAAPHQGLGVDQYAWSTSPLRRYTDLVNQWQILACIKHGVAAPLVAPFKSRDADLFAIVSAFDSAYAAYADFQNIMENYWCLRWLGQQSLRKVQAVQLCDDVVRLIDIPLSVPMTGAKYARGTQVTIELISWDEVDLSLQARLLEVSEAVTTVEDTDPFEEEDISDEADLLQEQSLSGDVDITPLSALADPTVQSDSAASPS